MTERSQVTALAQHQIKGVHLQHRVALLAAMTIIRNTPPQDVAFNDVAALANFLCELDSAFIEAEVDDAE